MAGKIVLSLIKEGEEIERTEISAIGENQTKMVRNSPAETSAWGSRPNEDHFNMSQKDLFFKVRDQYILEARGDDSKDVKLEYGDESTPDWLNLGDYIPK